MAATDHSAGDSQVVAVDEVSAAGQEDESSSHGAAFPSSSSSSRFFLFFSNFVKNPNLQDEPRLSEPLIW